MFVSLLKKEFLQFIRNKANLVMLFVFPIVLITTLSFGLEDMMNSSSKIFEKGDKDSTVYYYIDKNCDYEEGFNTFKKEISKSINVDFKEKKLTKSIKKKIDNYDAIIHINVSNDGFKVYSSSKGDSTKSKILKGVFESLVNQIASYQTIYKNNPQAFQNLIDKNVNSIVDENKDLRNESSSEYYTFAELGLIILYIATIVSESVSNENKFTTINRLRLSKLRESYILLAKVFMGVLIGIVQTLLVYVYSTNVLNVNWGDNTLKFMAIYIALSFFASMLGALVGICSKTEGSASGGILNGLIIFFCAFGGCYTPLFLIISSPTMEYIAKISPLYWINTATSSMICGIDTSSYIVAVVYPIVFSIVALILYLIINKSKGGIAND